jgi:type IV secretory pathway VirB2 component (pilin)
MKRLFAIFLLSFVLLSPTALFAVDVDDGCLNDTATCECLSLEEDAYEATTVRSVPECQTFCATQAVSKPSLSAYEVTCTSPDGDFGAIANGSVSTDSGPEKTPSKALQSPTLAIEIPGLVFSDPYETDGSTGSNFIGEYISAIYKWLLGVAAIIATIMLMVAGLQWAVARGNQSVIDQAKERIGKAIMGIVLLFGAYTIAFFIDPALTAFESLEIAKVDPILQKSIQGEEGQSGGGNAAGCEEAVTLARANGTCDMSQKILSVIDASGASSYSCNYHLRDADYDYTKINSLDYPGTFGNPIYAPFSGNITYTKGVGGKCGNSASITGSGGSATLCHLKDFTGADGSLIPQNKRVERGDVIGHIGGTCCSGEQPPTSDEWSKIVCTTSGNPCSNPSINNIDCSCQPWKQSGHTTGAHVHLTLYSGGDLLACHE